MAFIRSDLTEAIIGRRFVALKTLHKIGAVKHEQTGNAQPLIIALRHRHDAEKVFKAQVTASSAHINEGGD